MPTTYAPKQRVARPRGNPAVAGNRVGVVEASGERVTWTYDAAYQLTRERRSGVASYDVTHTYDPAGNRTLKIDSGARTTAAYDAGNRLRYRQDGSGRTTYVFDASGNQIKQKDPAGQITTSTWNYENRNTVIRQPAGTRVTFTYNGDQVRFQKQTAAGTWKYVYDGENRLVETDGSNAAQAVYTIEPLTYGNLVSQRQLVGGVWSQIYYHFDALGSTDRLTDSAQVVTDSYTYVAFGELKTSTGTTTNPFTWVGQVGYVRDQETGEYHLRARQYLPDAARFKSEDPLGTGPDANVFRYVGNRPVDDIDPSGEKSRFEWHHLLPRMFFDPNGAYGDLFGPLGFVENAATNGWLLDCDEHDAIHPAWEKKWKKWIDNRLKKGIPITKEAVQRQLAKMKKLPEFKKILDTGRQAPYSYSKWNSLGVQKKARLFKALAVFASLFALFGAVDDAQAMCEPVTMFSKKEMRDLYEKALEQLLEGDIQAAEKTLLSGPDRCPPLGDPKAGLICIMLAQIAKSNPFGVSLAQEMESRIRLGWSKMTQQYKGFMASEITEECADCVECKSEPPPIVFQIVLPSRCTCETGWCKSCSQRRGKDGLGQAYPGRYYE